MKCFELLSLLVVVFEFGLFGAVNGNFRAERPNIDGEPNLVRLVDCSGQITYNGSTIASKPFTVDNSNAGVYSCPDIGESVTVIRKSSILLLLYYYYYDLLFFQLYLDPQLILLVLLIGDSLWL